VNRIEQNVGMGIGEHDVRPWGNYTVLDEGDSYKVKRIVVDPGERLSYQRHAHRDEHWVAVSGEGVVTLDDQRVALTVASPVDVPRDMPHRVSNDGSEPLVFIEVQRGAYLGEDDIVRLEDDYGRSG
jgi:mannose-6-phosphate isomerase-like protein (cupin superfamily)